MKLSVIVLCYNEKETINTVLSSVKESNIEDLEIIVIDDFSIDGTREILKNLCDDRIKVFFMKKIKGKVLH